MTKFTTADDDEDIDIRGALPMPHVVVVGNDNEGFEAFGTFPNGDEAVSWAVGRYSKDYWILPIMPSP